MRALGAAARQDGEVYLTGGATAVLIGWRASTIDVDVLFVPEQDALLRELQRIKNDLRVNVELASPLDFVPVPAGWEDRSVFTGREGRLTFRHFDPYAQALSKLERAHAQDLEDVAAMLDRGLVDPQRALAYVDEIEADLYRFPAIDASSFTRRAREILAARP
jgi:non-ribosomal peptide synthetase component F